jgi:prepilin-type processing-associated H-X9-DG protein
MAAEQLALDRHQNKCNWAHVDGHVEPLHLTDVYYLHPESAPGDLIWVNNRFDPRVAK